MSFDPARVVNNYKSRTGVTISIPNLEILIEEFYNEMKNNGEISGTSGSVNGQCPPTGGPLTLGTLSGGKFS